jgi:hypothetical protein
VTLRLRTHVVGLCGRGHSVRSHRPRHAARSPRQFARRPRFFIECLPRCPAFRTHTQYSAARRQSALHSTAETPRSCPSGHSGEGARRSCSSSWVSASITGIFFDRIDQVLSNQTTTLTQLRRATAVSAPCAEPLWVADPTSETFVGSVGSVDLFGSFRCPQGRGSFLALRKPGSRRLPTPSRAPCSFTAKDARFAVWRRRQGDASCFGSRDASASPVMTQNSSPSGSTITLHGVSPWPTQARAAPRPISRSTSSSRVASIGSRRRGHGS